jgi:hypothetical protein
VNIFYIFVEGHSIVSVMQPIIEYCHRQQERFQSAASSIERQHEASDLDCLVRSLRCFRALFNLPGSWDIHWPVDVGKRNAMMELLDQARHVNDMHLQQRVMRENENLLGMDLSYLIDYANELASDAEQNLRVGLNEFDQDFPRRYIEAVEKQVQEVGDEPMYEELLDFTHQQLKKTFKKLKHLDEESHKIHRIRARLIDTIYYLELLNQTDEAQEIRERGLFLDIWHDRMMALDLIARYKHDHPQGAGNNMGTLEILEDYINQKVLIL